jgi:hypothetical protein
MEHGKPFKVKNSGFFNGNDFFLRVPDCIKRNPDLNALDKLIWSQLAWLNFQYNGKVHPRLDTLANELGSSKRGIQNSLIRLRDRGYITWKTPSLAKRNKEANEYSLLWRAEFEAVEENAIGEKQPVEQTATGPMEQTATAYGQPVEDSAIHYDNLHYEYKRKHDNTQTPGGGVCVSSDSHESEEAIGGNGGSGPTAKQEFDNETEEYIERKSRQEGKPPARFERWLRKEARKNGGWLDFPESELNQLRENDSVDTGPDPEFTDPPIEKLREVAEQWKREERGEISQPDPTEQRSKVQQEIIEQMEDGLRHGCTVQAAADMLVLDRENFLPSYRIDYVRQQMHNIYPSEVNTALLKAQLMRKVKASFRGPDERTKALQQLQRLDPERGARLKEETGVCDAIF